MQQRQSFPCLQSRHAVLHDSCILCCTASARTVTCRLAALHAGGCASRHAALGRCVEMEVKSFHGLQFAGGTAVPHPKNKCLRRHRRWPVAPETVAQKPMPSSEQQRRANRRRTRGGCRRTRKRSSRTNDEETRTQGCQKKRGYTLERRCTSTAVGHNWPADHAAKERLQRLQVKLSKLTLCLPTNKRIALCWA